MNAENNTYGCQHQCQSRERKWFEVHEVLDIFVILVCKPHCIDNFLDDWHLEKATMLILHKRPMLFTTYK